MATIVRSPWGPVQSVKNIGPGIDFVSTASHGGIKLDRLRNFKMPEAFRLKGGWYEEDCEASLVIITFPECFDAEIVVHAQATVKNFFPEQYEKHYNIVIPENQSFQKRWKDFEDKTANKYVVNGAWGDWHELVPEGMVMVCAICKSKGSKENYFLVPEEEYKKRNEFGFVIDETKHQRIDPIK